MKTNITSHELRELYLSFFESKGHTRIPSAPLVPEHDPSVLFTTAGMHPLVPYLLGQTHPKGRRLTNAQKCLRTNDIDDVGDATHATVFEMLGNWSLGDYFKKEVIEYTWELLTSRAWLGLDPRRLAVSVYAGDEDAPRDDEAVRAWRSLGLPDARIAYLGKDDNWWPAGGKTLGPQGPDSEMFYWTSQEKPPDAFDAKDTRWAELGNNVFMQFERTSQGRLIPLKQKNIDTGMGLERMMMAIGGLASVYELDTFAALMSLLGHESRNQDTRHMRIVADHIKAATFLLGDERPVVPGASEQGYVLRRLIRRAMRSARQLHIDDVSSVFDRGLELMIQEYGDAYPSLLEHEARARQEMAREIERFEHVLAAGLKKFEQMQAQFTDNVVSGKDSFHLYESYGFPIELTLELAGENGLTVDRAGFDAAFGEHRKSSRQASEGKFKGGLADHSQDSVRYHTATHLLHQALRTVLGAGAEQRGSNITPQRLRFDFAYPAKLTSEQITRVQALVNEKIAENLVVTREEMTLEEAKKHNALGLFADKYGERVSVYSIGDFSREICGGPHVRYTGELGRFTITKEEAVSAGIRRIKAVLQPV